MTVALTRDEAHRLCSKTRQGQCSRLRQACTADGSMSELVSPWVHVSNNAPEPLAEALAEPKILQHNCTAHATVTECPAMHFKQW